MIEVLNGKLYQWDVGRQVKVDSDVCEVHFASCNSKNAYVTVPVNGVANIPNVLLQNGEYIVIYAVCENDSCEQTVEYIREWINQRPKPDDYVYTETEVFSYKQLEERIKLLEDNSGSSGGSGVSDVLVNGASIIDKNGNAVIPIANTSSFGVSKFAGTYAIDNWRNNKSYQNMYALGITEFDHALKQGMCDGKGAEWTQEEKAMARNRLGIDVWEEVADITIEEEVGDVILEFPNGYSELYVYVSQTNVEEIMVGNLFVYPMLQNDKNKVLRTYMGVKISATYPDVVLRCINHNDTFIEVLNTTCNAQKNTTTYQQWVHYYDKTFNEKLVNIDTFNFYGLYCAMGKVGTRIRVLGVRA